MAKFTIQLDTRRKLQNGLYNLVVRVNVGNDNIYLNIAKLTEQQYNHVFVTRAVDEESIAFREKCEDYRTKCERTFNKVRPFDKTRFRELLKEKESKIPDTLLLKDLFDDYSNNFEYIKHNSRLRYRTTGNVFESFKKGATVFDVTPDFLRNFEKIKLSQNLSPATISSYMIDLRRILNYFMKVKKIIPAYYEYPFGEGRYRIRKPRSYKQVLENTEIQALARLKEFDSPEEEYALDIWLFCYRCNGANYVDILRLRWENVQNKCIVYYRKKTETTQTINKRPVRVALNDVIQQSLDKLGKKDGPFVLGLLKEGYSENTITNKSNKERLIINRHLKSIENRLKLSAPLRLSTARDCYATCLKRAGTPTQIISEQLVHSSVNVTENYLGSMNIEEIIKINSVIY